MYINWFPEIVEGCQRAKNFANQGLEAEALGESIALPNAISFPINHGVSQYLQALHTLNILEWSFHRPIQSIVILVLAIAILWSIINRIIHLLETASWSILQLPLKILWAGAQPLLAYISKIFTSFMAQILNINQVPITTVNYKQQRLREIAQRLEVIQREQKELLTEAAELLNGLVSQELKPPPND